MAPTPPQSAYHLYFRFYKNVALRPSLRIASIRGDKTNKEVYKNFVQTVLDADLNDGSFDGDAVQQRYFGNDSFSGMSKQISKKWREVDELTRSIFKELAAEDSERYKKELFDSYQSFVKSHSVSMKSFHFNDKGRKDQHEENKDKDPIRVVSSSTSSCMQSHITEVDMADEEIISMAISIWGLNPPSMVSPIHNNHYFASDDGIGDFLSGIDWNRP